MNILIKHKTLNLKSGHLPEKIHFEPIECGLQFNEWKDFQAQTHIHSQIFLNELGFHVSAFEWPLIIGLKC